MSQRPFAEYSLDELDRISRSEFLGRDRLALLELELTARSEAQGSELLRRVSERLYGTPATIQNSGSAVGIAAPARTDFPAEGVGSRVALTPTTTPSKTLTIAFRSLGVAGSCVLAYVNFSYVHQVWSDARTQGAHLWVMVLSLVLVGTPLMFPVTIIGTIAPGIALWNPQGKVLKSLFGGVFALALGPLLAQLPWAAWGFLVLFMK